MNIHEFVSYLRYLCIRSLFFKSHTVPNADSHSILYGFSGQQTWKIVEVIKDFIEKNPSPQKPSDASFSKLESDHFFSWFSDNFTHSQIFLVFSGYSTYFAKGEVALDGRDIDVILEVQFNPFLRKLFLIRLKNEAGTMIAEQDFE